MTFTRPLSGTFAYKGIIPSSVMNTINNDFPNALDKTGDNVGNGGGISGEIDVLSGGSIYCLPGSTVTLAGLLLSNITWADQVTGPYLTQAAMGIDFAATFMTIQAQDAFASASVNQNGGTIRLQSGNAATGGGTNGGVILSMGHSPTEVYVLEANPTTTALYGGGTLNIQANASATVLYGAGVQGFALNATEIAITQPLIYTYNASAPGLTVQTTSLSAGSNMTISAQTTTASSQPGGNLVLGSGVGTSQNGSIIFDVGATQQAFLGDSGFTVFPYSSYGMAFGVNKWHGTPNTQQGEHKIFPYFATTTAGGSNVNIATFIIPNGSGFSFDINWVRKDITTPGGVASNIIKLNITAASGVTAYETALLIPASGTFAPLTDIVFTGGTNTLAIAVHAQTDAYDWQVIITLNAN